MVQKDFRSFVDDLFKAIDHKKGTDETSVSSLGLEMMDWGFIEFGYGVRFCK